MKTAAYVFLIYSALVIGISLARASDDADDICSSSLACRPGTVCQFSNNPYRHYGRCEEEVDLSKLPRIPGDTDYVAPSTDCVLLMG